jgi:hypothetical protein
MARKHCRAICTVNQLNHRHGAEYRCEEVVIVTNATTEPTLCWTHKKAYSNRDRTEPLRLVDDDTP